MKEDSQRRQKRFIGILITVVSFAGGAASAYSGQGDLFSLVVGTVVGLGLWIAYNFLARMHSSWVPLSLKDVLSWIVVW